MKNFISVSTAAARFQDISLNPQKLAGMCAKLKCCLNYEVDDYIEHGRLLPSREVVLQTMDADYFLFKSDILAGLVTYSTDKRLAANLETITAQRAKEVIEMNRRGEKPESLHPSDHAKEQQGPVDLLADGDIHRFDKSKKKKKKKPTQKPQPVQAKQPAQPKQSAPQPKSKPVPPAPKAPKTDKKPKENEPKA
jgi:outer membrane biosynthesis protein TonB